MRQSVIRICKRSLVAGGAAAGLAFLGMLLLRIALREMGWEPAPMATALEFSLILGAISFALCAVLELLSACWRCIRGSKPKSSPAVAPDPSKVGDQP